MSVTYKLENCDVSFHWFDYLLFVKFLLLWNGENGCSNLTEVSSELALHHHLPRNLHQYDPKHGDPRKVSARKNVSGNNVH